MPHATKSFINVAHDLRRRIAPAQLEELLPNVTSVAMDNGFWDTAEQLVNHGGLVIFGHAVEGLLDDVAAEGVHAESKRVATDCLSNGNDLLWRAMLEATLNQEVSKAVDHQSVGLEDDGLDNVVLLLWRTDLELLLEEDGSLLVVVADDLVDDVLPVAAHVSVQKSTVVHGLNKWHVLRATGLARSL